MKISFWWIGKTKEKYLKEGVNIYEKRLRHYIKYEITEFNDFKKIKSSLQLISSESSMILSRLDDNDFLVLCDEQGLNVTSVELADLFSKWTMNTSFKRVVILVGGAFGVSTQVKERANFKLALSNLTFSHQMVRLILLEQVYRAFTIINNEKYHNV